MLGRLKSTTITPSGGSEYLVSYVFYHRYIIDEAGEFVIVSGDDPVLPTYQMVEQRSYPGRPLPPLPTETPTGEHLWKKVYYDGLGREIRTEAKSTGGRIVVSQTTYNERGQVEKKYLPRYQDDSNEVFVEYDYDEAGRVLSVTAPDASRTESAYKKGVTTIIDAKGHKRTEKRDAYGRLEVVREFKGSGDLCSLYATTTYGYDVLGNLVEVQPATVDLGGGLQIAPPATEIGYDTLSRKIWMNDPDMDEWSYGESVVDGSLRSKQVDARGKETVTIYDELGRVKQKKPLRLLCKIHLRSSRHGQLQGQALPSDRVRRARG